MNADLAPLQPLGKPVGKQSQMAQSSWSAAKAGIDRVNETTAIKKYFPSIKDQGNHKKVDAK